MLYLRSDSSFRLDPIESIKKFCGIINPATEKAIQAFHPKAVMDRIAKIGLNKGEMPPRLESRTSVQKLLDNAYKQALKRHARENPTGPLPRKIEIFRLREKDGYELRWKTRAKTWISLFRESGPKEDWSVPESTISISGWNEVSVRKYCLFAGLPEPIGITPPFPKPEKTLGISEMNAFVKAPTFANVRVPLGEFLDFIQKYQ